MLLHVPVGSSAHMLTLSQQGRSQARTRSVGAPGVMCIASERLSWSKGLASESSVSDMSVVLRGAWCLTAAARSEECHFGQLLDVSVSLIFAIVDLSCPIRGGNADNSIEKPGLLLETPPKKVER